jgi:BlaI family transcriptional regulator, penicillinase repressor
LVVPRQKRRRSNQLTPLELEVMNALWKGGPGTVNAVKERLPGTPPLAYNTVQTVLGILFRKRHVTRDLVGKAFVYRPVATRQRTARTAVREVIDKLFGGSSIDLVMSIVDSKRLTRSELRRIRLLIKKHEDDSR